MSLRSLSSESFYLGNLGNALKQRLTDSNKVVQGLALEVIAGIAFGMNKPFEKHARLFIGPTIAILADAKISVRAPAIAALSAIFSQCGLECMISAIASGLEAANPLQRKELSTWLCAKLEEASTLSVDFAPLAGPILSCLEDRSTEVRKAAQALLPSIIAHGGSHDFLDKANKLKPASRSTVIPLIEAAEAAALVNGTNSPVNSSAEACRPQSSTSKATFAATTSSTTIKAPLRGISAASRSLKPSTSSSSSSTSRSATPSSAVGKGANLPTGTQANDPVPHSSGMSSNGLHEPLLTGKDEPPFRTSDPQAKQTRAAKETGPLRWVIEGSARTDQVDYLHQQMLPHLSIDLISLLFSKDPYCERDFLAGMTLIVEAGTTPFAADKYGIDPSDMKARLVANADLILKYLTIRLSDTATNITLRCLDVVDALFALMLDGNGQLSDYEAGAFLPNLIAKVRMLRFWRLAR